MCKGRMDNAQAVLSINERRAQANEDKLRRRGEVVIERRADDSAVDADAAAT